MSTTSQIDATTSCANPTPVPAKRITVPQIRQRKLDGVTAERIVVLTAYTARQAQLIDAHCDILLVGDSVGQVIYGLPSSVPVKLDVMIEHAAAVVRGRQHALVVVDLPFGSYEASPTAAFNTAARVLKETGCDAIKLEGGEVMAKTVDFLVQRGVPVMGHVGLTPQAINVLGNYNARGNDAAEADKILADARALEAAGAFAIVIEGVVEPLAAEIARQVSCPTISIGGSVECDGQVLVTDDMMGMFDRVPRFVKQYASIGATISEAAAHYAADVRSRSFPNAEQTYAPRVIKPA